MGMQVQATWGCERCEGIEIVSVGQIPSGWKAITLLGLAVTSEGAVDVKLPQPGDTLVLCKKCCSAFEMWAGITREDDVAPVEHEADTPAASDKEKTLWLATHLRYCAVQEWYQNGETGKEPDCTCDNIVVDDISDDLVEPKDN